MRENETEGREDYSQVMGSRWLCTDTMHNYLKVHSGMHEYNFRGIGIFFRYYWVPYLNQNEHKYTEGCLYSL